FSSHNLSLYCWVLSKQITHLKSCPKIGGHFFLTPQTVTGQIKALEERLEGKLTKRNGRSIEPTELGQLVFKYADRMFGLSYEMLDIVNYSQRANVLFDVGVADALSKRLVSKILMTTVPEDNRIHLRCFESTHELLLEQLSQHKLDMILSDCPVDSSQSPGLFSKKLGESHMGLFSSSKVDRKAYPAILANQKLLIPGSRTAMGRKVRQWFERKGLQPNVLGEFDDAALMKAFALYHPDVIFMAPLLLRSEMEQEGTLHLISQIEEIKEEYYVIFAERMIQHPAVKSVCDADFQHFFEQI
ncbi:transcriptional activator NhaR, partial [Vibrio cincinnatiensis]